MVLDQTLMLACPNLYYCSIPLSLSIAAQNQLPLSQSVFSFVARLCAQPLWHRNIVAPVYDFVDDF